MTNATNTLDLDAPVAVRPVNEIDAGATQATDRVDLPKGARWSWSCRHVDKSASWQLDADDQAAPRIGDVALVEVDKIANHTSLITAENEKMRIYEGDKLLCVFGNRYATDAFEGEAQTVEVLHLMTAGGMIGTVQTKHRSVKTPSQVSFLGYVTDPEGARLNLKDLCFTAKKTPLKKQRKIIFAVGTGMNSGKTTTSARMVRGLVERGVRVAACKLTGSVSHRDLFEMRATSPVFATDFSDYGFPSTYLCEREELLDLFHTMIADCEAHDPEAIVIEIADGVLQRETQILLNDPEVSQYVVEDSAHGPVRPLGAARDRRCASHRARDDGRVGHHQQLAAVRPRVHRTQRRATLLFDRRRGRPRRGGHSIDRRNKRLSGGDAGEQGARLWTHASRRQTPTMIRPQLRGVSASRLIRFETVQAETNNLFLTRRDPTMRYTTSIPPSRGDASQAIPLLASAVGCSPSATIGADRAADQLNLTFSHGARWDWSRFAASVWKELPETD